MAKRQVTGQELHKLRSELGINQSAFWAAFGVTQSAGSRYESGRKMLEPTRKLFIRVYGDALEEFKATGRISESKKIAAAKLAKETQSL